MPMTQRHMNEIPPPFLGLTVHLIIQPASTLDLDRLVLPQSSLPFWRKSSFTDLRVSSMMASMNQNNCDFDAFKILCASTSFTWKKALSNQIQKRELRILQLSTFIWTAWRKRENQRRGQRQRWSENRLQEIELKRKKRGERREEREERTYLWCFSCAFILDLSLQKECTNTSIEEHYIKERRWILFGFKTKRTKMVWTAMTRVSNQPSIKFQH